MRILLTGGGSGGHIFPLVAVAQELKKRKNDIEFLYIGTRSQMGTQAEDIMSAEDIPTKNILAAKLRRYFSLHYLVDILKAPIGFLQCLWHLLVFMPDVIFSKGGYVSVPVVIVAWLYRIPVLTHESDAVPGWANRVIGKFSRYIATSYPSTERYFLASKVVLTGNPIRPELTQGDATRGRERWGFSESQPIIFIIGGSQGAQVINDAIIRILPELSHRAQILHQTGEHNYDRVVAEAARAGFKSDRHRYVARAFFAREEMADAYACANLIVSRAGANSLTEIAANKKASILIPLESHDQPVNAQIFAQSADTSRTKGYDQMQAYALAGVGGAVVLEQANLGEHLLMEKIVALLDQPELTHQMSQRIGVFYHPDAAAQIADGILLMVE